MHADATITAGCAATISVDLALRPNRWQLLTAPLSSPEAESGASLGINQNAFISRACLDAGTTLTYETKSGGSAGYVFVIEGEVEGEVLVRRDAIGLRNCEVLGIEATLKSEVLVVETSTT